MKLVLVNAHNAEERNAPGVHKVHIEHHASAVHSAASTDLLLLDTRSMDETVLSNALDLVTNYQGRERARFAVAVCPNPTLNVVVRVMRAGFNDIYQNPLSVKQLLRCLKPGFPRGSEARRRLFAFLSYSRVLGATPGLGIAGQNSEAVDFELRMREERIQNESRRLEGFREVLRHREEELRASTRRLEQDFARLQQDKDLPRRNGEDLGIAAGTAAHFKLLKELESELQTKARDLAAREHALGVRERMLTEFEAMLNNHLVRN